VLVIPAASPADRSGDAHGDAAEHTQESRDREHSADPLHDVLQT